MNEDLERRLRARLHEELPPAPAATRAFLERLPLDHPRVAARGGPARGAVMALVGIGLVALASMAGLGGSSEPPDGVVSSPPLSLPSPTGPPPPSSSADTFDGLTIYSVSELLARRSAGRIGGERVALRGFWSDLRFWHSCVVAHPPPGELAIFCRDREFGITERDEPIGTVTHTGGGTRYEPTDGPALTPFVEEALAERLDLPHINGQFYAPVPILVVGHFDDHRAEACRPDFRQRCRDRLVLDEIVEFDPKAVPTPGITPSPTPFPFDDPPSAPFSKENCLGDVPYSFIGWGSGAAYGLDLPSGSVVFIMVTRDEVRRPGTGTVARWVCWAHEGATVFHSSKLPSP